MEQCLYAVMLESANECAYAVAEHVGQKLGGDYRTFIDLMNSVQRNWDVRIRISITVMVCRMKITGSARMIWH